MTLTFNNLIVRARRRIHDLRDASAVIITDSTKDGIRWSAADLATNITESLIEISRDLVAYDIKGYINTSVRYGVTTATIKKSTGLIEFSVQSSKFYDVVKIESVGKQIWKKVTASEFASDDYRNSLEDEYVFTSYLDIGTKAIIYATYPINADADTNVKATCTLDLKELFVTTNESELPFYGIDDLVLDYIERNCKQDEYDLQRVAELTQTIDKKLQVLKANEAVK